MPIAPFLLAGLNIAGNLAGGLFGAKKQAKVNRQTAEYQYGKQMEMMKYQNEYNSPSAQMARFKEAGLNPNLMYGQGNAGNMTSSPSYTENPADYQTPISQATSNIGTQFTQSKLALAQASLTNQKVEESGIKQGLMVAQRNLINVNPYMNPRYVEAMVTNLESVAKLKEQDARFWTNKEWYKTGENELTYQERGYQRMTKELELLEQKYNLGNADQKLKAEILQGKDWQNDLIKIQKNWMESGDITPQHIYQGIMMLLTKMF